MKIGFYGVLSVVALAGAASVSADVISAGDFLARRVCISDTLQFTAASGTSSCVDPERACVWSSHMFSRTNFGESGDGMALVRTPIAQFHRARTWILADRGRPLKGGTRWNVLYSYYNIMHGDKVRCYFLCDAEHYRYLDFDPKTESVGVEHPVMCKWDDESPVPLTSAPLDRYLKSRGMKGYDLLGEPNEHLIVVGRPLWKDGGYYGTVTSPQSQPVVFHTGDHETFEFVGVIPEVCKYECMIAELNGTMYALLRQTAPGKDNFWTSTDKGRTWSPSGYLPHGTCRAQLMTYKGKLLIAYSLAGIKPNIGRDCRNNMIILRGEGGDLSKYEEVFRVVDPLGFVQYDLQDYKGRLLCIWSNSELYPDKPQEWCHAVQGKDALFASWIDGL